MVSMAKLILMQRKGTEPIFFVCILYPLLILFSKTLIQTLMLCVNRPYGLVHACRFCTVFEIGNLDLFNMACEQFHTNEYNSF